MNQRLQRYLDGEIRKEELNAIELQEVAALESLIEEARHTSENIRTPDVTLGVMMRIQEAIEMPRRNNASSLAEALRWLWQPQPLRLRPAYGVVALSILAALLMWTLRGSPPSDTLATNGKVFVQFRIDLPDASAVRLAGNFTEWQPTYVLQQVRPGTWSILVPLDPGVYNYAFVVNEKEWVADPAAPAVADGFGGLNSQVSVLLPGEF